jgi:phosphoribosylaminoimidazole-succinocarboxamide synthase
MTTLSPARLSVPTLSGLEDPINRGKIADSYDVIENNLLTYRSDGVSIFDHVLDCLVPQKGMVLTAMSHYSLKLLEQYGVKTHLVAAGAEINRFLPERLRGDTAIQSRSLVVRKLIMDDAEFIARSCFVKSSSSFRGYNIETGGEICGHALPPGLQDGDPLPFILDTPTTKAKVGHDEALPASEMRLKFPEQTLLLLETFQIMSRHGEERGIKLVDTKLEFGRDYSGTVRLADETYTPDSSRFLSLALWLLGRIGEKRSMPPPWDKQFVRAWGLEHGINNLRPENPDDVAKVHALQVPAHLIEMTTQIYRYICWRWTGRTLENYMIERLGVPLERPKKKVAIIFGSESDIPTIRAFAAPTAWSNFAGGKPEVHVISCHRNPDLLRQYARDCKDDVIIAAGGKAFAMPGILDAFLHAEGKHIPVIGVALGQPNSDSLKAAELSISDLPGEPVLMDELSGKVYSGPEGFLEAIRRVAFGELPPKKSRTERPAKLRIDAAELLFR